MCKDVLFQLWGREGLRDEWEQPLNGIPFDDKSGSDCHGDGVKKVTCFESLLLQRQRTWRPTHWSEFYFHKILIKINSILRTFQCWFSCLNLHEKSPIIGGYFTTLSQISVSCPRAALRWIWLWALQPWAERHAFFLKCPPGKSIPCLELKLAGQCYNHPFPMTVKGSYWNYDVNCLSAGHRLARN